MPTLTELGQPRPDPAGPATGVEDARARVRQGLAILTQPRRYLREVAAWQGVGWLLRFVAFWFFLEAFDIPATPRNVMLVLAVQSVATATTLAASATSGLIGEPIALTATVSPIPCTPWVRV